MLDKARQPGSWCPGCQCHCAHFTANETHPEHIDTTCGRHHKLLGHIVILVNGANGRTRQQPASRTSNSKPMSNIHGEDDLKMNPAPGNNAALDSRLHDGGSIAINQGPWLCMGFYFSFPCWLLFLLCELRLCGLLGFGTPRLARYAYIQCAARIRL